MHYHAAGDVELDGFNPSKRYPNGACRCDAHIAKPLKATRAVPQCDKPCYMCQRVEQLKVRLGIR